MPLPDIQPAYNLRTTKAGFRWMVWLLAWRGVCVLPVHYVPSPWQQQQQRVAVSCCPSPFAHLIETFSSRPQISNFYSKNRSS